MTESATVLFAQSYGSPEVLEFHSQPIPRPGAGEVVVEVRAAGINPIDARRMTGEFGGPLPQTFGTEFSGVVLEIGAGVGDWSAGDDVLGSGAGYTHATHIVVPATNLVAKPATLSWAVAGSLPGVSQTAATILRELGLTKGSSLLVHGGSGGVGSIAIQLATQRGITVVATASAANQEYLATLGAIPVVYGEGLTERLRAAHPEPFDGAVDMIGSTEAIESSLALVKSDGPIGTIAGKPVSSPRVQAMWVKRNREDLQEVVDGVADGSLTWVVSRAVPFADANKAFADILEGHTKGKSALVFG